MSPQEYEYYVASVYEKDGYKTTVTPYAGDGGIDIIAVKDGKRIAIQCKNYGDTTRLVNAAMIRDIYAAAKVQDCNEAHLATDGNLLPDAEKTAEKLNVCIRYIYPNQALLDKSFKDITGLSKNKSNDIDPDTNKKAEEIDSFDKTWEKIKTLVGEQVFLLSQKDQFNIITMVDNSGLKRKSKNGIESKKIVPIKAFRFAYNRLIQNMEVTRDEINQENPERCSSIVIAVLARVLPVEVITNPSLRLKLKV